jgi:hypothetical protein
MSDGFAMAIERLQRETAGIDLAAFFHELDNLVVEILVAGKCLGAECGEATLYAERDAGTVKKDGRLEALAASAAWPAAG